VVIASPTLAQRINQPAITSLSPSAVGSDSLGLTLTVNGSEFASGAIVFWNGAPLATTFVSANELTAVVPSKMVYAAGKYGVNVGNPNSAPGASGSFT